MQPHKASLKPQADHRGVVPEPEEELTADQTPENYRRPRGGYSVYMEKTDIQSQKEHNMSAHYNIIENISYIRNVYA